MFKVAIPQTLAPPPPPPLSLFSSEHRSELLLPEALQQVRGQASFRPGDCVAEHPRWFLSSGASGLSYVTASDSHFGRYFRKSLVFRKAPLLFFFFYQILKL